MDYDSRCEIICATSRAESGFQDFVRRDQVISKDIVQSLSNFERVDGGVIEVALKKMRIKISGLIRLPSTSC